MYSMENYILWYKLLFFLSFILATIGNNSTLFKIVDGRQVEAQGWGGGGLGGTSIITAW